MTVTAAAPLAKDVSTMQAREELAKFFQIADLAQKAPEMFSKFIDAEWHRLMHSPDYSAFCTMSVGHPVGHQQDKGYGTPSWLDIYHERFGTLPAEWFASTEGIVDLDAYESYLDSRTTNVPYDCTPTTSDPGSGHNAIITAWDCTPTTNDPDFAPKTKPGLITAWDCTPTTNDPDFKPPLTATWDCNTGPTPTNPNMLFKTQPDSTMPPVPDLKPEKAK